MHNDSNSLQVFSLNHDKSFYHPFPLNLHVFYRISQDGHEGKRSREFRSNGPCRGAPLAEGELAGLRGRP